MTFAGYDYWKEHFVPERELKEKILERYEMTYEGEEGVSHVFRLGNGYRVGFISPMSRPFCGGCSRVRLTARGDIILCMFDKFSYSIKGYVRPRLRRKELVSFMREVVVKKPGGIAYMPEYTSGLHPMVQMGG